MNGRLRPVSVRFRQANGEAPFGAIAQGFGTRHAGGVHNEIGRTLVASERPFIQRNRLLDGFLFNWMSPAAYGEPHVWASY